MRYRTFLLLLLALVSHGAPVQTKPAELTVDGIQIPQERQWHHHNDAFAATDQLVSAEALTKRRL